MFKYPSGNQEMPLSMKPLSSLDIRFRMTSSCSAIKDSFPQQIHSEFIPVFAIYESVQPRSGVRVIFPSLNSKTFRSSASPSASGLCTSRPVMIVPGALFSQPYASLKSSHMVHVVPIKGRFDDRPDAKLKSFPRIPGSDILNRKLAFCCHDTLLARFIKQIYPVYLVIL